MDNGLEKTADTLTDNARDLIAATANAADEKIVRARNRLSSVIESAQNTYATVQKKTVETAQATDKAIRANPYTAIGIAFGVGALVGFLISSRRDR
jgi:ElaB/YqjD/DUF883 family membrane-anchored ribosome-binding protein